MPTITSKFAMSNDRNPYSKPLIILAVQIVFLSALFSFYEVEVPLGRTFSWIGNRVYHIPVVKNTLHKLRVLAKQYLPKLPVSLTSSSEPKPKHKIDEGRKNAIETSNNKEGHPVITAEELALHDGTRVSRPVYLAILGRVFDVDKGRKHYGEGGGYHFFAGRDATRAFVSGDFSADGLTADVSGLTESELLSIADWISFYERDYRLVGVLAGIYYDRRGRPTELLKEVNARIQEAKLWKNKQLKQQEVFPPCNSEWKKDTGGRVWCTQKSGGVSREWVGVPRKLFSPGSKNHRCVCVKNFGESLSSPGARTNRGDLDNRALEEYEECPPEANSCRTQP